MTEAAVQTDYTPVKGEGIPIPGETKPDASRTVEDLARSKGWKPKEEFDGPTERFVGAEEFIGREPLIESIKSLKKEIRESKKTVDEMARFHAQSVEREVAKRISTLKAEKRDAIELGDVAKVEAIEKKIDAEQKAAPPKAPEIPVSVSEWIDRNAWFKTDSEMKDVAVTLNEAYLKKNPDDLAGSLEDTERKMRTLYPHKFADSGDTKSSPPKASPVEGSAPPARTGRKSLRDLPHEAQAACKAYVKAGVMSEADYIKSYLGDDK
jgi:hypothetical protein